MNLEQYAQFLLQRIPTAKKASGGRVINCRCFYCPDSRDPRSKHFYISIPQSDNEPSYYYCHKCHASGVVTYKKLIEWDIYDEQIALDLEKHNKNCSRYSSNKKYFDQLENIERKISVAYENRNEADKQADQAKKKAAQYEKELTEIAPMVKEMERFAEKYSADPEEVLPEAGTLETGKSYREKKAKPLIKKIVTVLRSVYRAYLDLSRRFSDMQRSYERAWDKVNSLTVRVEELWNENRTLKERMGDFYLVERALGRDTVETIVLREKRLEEEQRVQRRKQKRKMDRDAR